MLFADLSVRAFIKCTQTLDAAKTQSADLSRVGQSVNNYIILREICSCFMVID